jgi:hypothetical protein
MAINLEPAPATLTEKALRKPRAKASTKTRAEVDAERAAEAGTDGYALFVSVDNEPVQFRMGVYEPYRYNGSRLAWRIPLDVADRFEQHHWVVEGRVVRLED